MPDGDWIKPKKIIFGGVPTSVENQPMEEGKAITRRKEVSKEDISFAEKSGMVSETLAHTENPIGSNINVVDVFITHMLIEAETSMKPPTNLAPLCPMAINIFNTSRLCNPDDSMPRAKIKPPINK